MASIPYTLSKQQESAFITEAIEAWTKAWEELEQSRIQAWIERIVDHLEEVRKLEGGNHYREGRRRV
ncbi:hypothetical protein GP486_001049 [Trichoglossum hirsutum]|uniref:Uncharacterized protein n=1 Tax=Trichoglossum hirsutum TaxID=265104 RepID=A0A9P8LHS8_9PEZI|nr:hypothetical protein GP486_001049 [Trichoglossum hirsutum]